MEFFSPAAVVVVVVVVVVVFFEEEMKKKGTMLIFVAVLVFVVWKEAVMHLFPTMTTAGLGVCPFPRVSPVA